MLIRFFKTFILKSQTVYFFSSLIADTMYKTYIMKKMMNTINIISAVTDTRYAGFPPINITGNGKMKNEKAYPDDWLEA
jgi:hypothetical protein